jgi:ACS family glucarate transporter-like MFS transporter
MNTRNPTAIAKTRRLILAMLFGFSFVSYLERVNISIASELMMPALSLSKLQMGYVFSGFLTGYAIFQVPAGMLGDIKGPRFTLAAAGLLWGVATVFTGLIPGFVKGTTAVFLCLWIIRFLLGCAEAATYPVGTRAIRNWMPAAQRGFGNSVMFIGSSAATALAGPLISFLMVRFGWRQSFYVSSTVAFLIAALWYWYATDYPEQHKSVGGTDLARINHSKRARGNTAAVSRWILLRDRRVLFLSASYVSEGYVLFIFVFWLYIYLVDVRGFSMLRGGAIASLPWLTAVALAPLGGVVCDRLAARSSRLSGARWVIILGYGISGILLYAAAEADSRTVAVAALCISVGSLFFAETGFWSAAIYLAGEHSGAVSGVMNTAGILGGIASTLLVPILVKHFGWLTALGSGAAMAMLCTVLWWILDREAVLTVHKVR